MSRKVVISSVLIAIVLLASLVAACTQQATPTPTPTTPAPTPTTPTPTTPSGQTYTLTLAFSGSTHEELPFVAPNFWFPRMIQEASKGRLKIEIKRDLVPNANVAEAVIDGRADMGYYYAPWAAGTFPQFDFGSLPFYYPSRYAYRQAVKDPRLWKLLTDGYRAKGMVLLAHLPHEGAIDFYANKPLNTVAAFKDLKIRAAGLLTAYALELLGAKPLTIAAPEIPDALARGVIDAAYTGGLWALGIGMADVAKYTSTWDGFSAVWANPLVVNTKKFDALPADLQQLLRDQALLLEAQVAYGTDINDFQLPLAYRLAKVTVMPASAEEVAKARQLVAKPAVDKWLATAGADGQKILDIIKDYSALK